MKATSSWTDAVIESFEDLTPTVREFHIRPTGDAAAVQRHEPGSHLQVQLLVDGRPELRSYSLVGEPDGQTWRIAVKRLDDGRGGSRAMWRLAAGDRLQVSGPRNHFPLDFNA